MGDANLWACCIHSFQMHLSCLGPILFLSSPCFLHSPHSSAITVGVGIIRWITIWGALTHIWRPEIADGCDISCLLIWQRYFHFTKNKTPALLVQFSHSAVSDSATPRTAACQASLSITNSWSLLKLMSIELVMPSNHLMDKCLRRGHWKRIQNKADINEVNFKK